jgi:hypothetical protein
MKKKEVKWGVSETKKYAKSKKKHGGKRKGSGQPKKEPTKVMRIPLSKVAAVLATIGKA